MKVGTKVKYNQYHSPYIGMVGVIISFMINQAVGLKTTEVKLDNGMTIYVYGEPDQTLLEIK
jgi:hypothetical protein